MHKAANIAVERSLNRQTNSQSINSDGHDDDEVEMGRKPRSLSCDNSMFSRRHASQYTERKRRYTVSTVSESIIVRNEFFTEESIQDEDRVKVVVVNHAL